MRPNGSGAYPTIDTLAEECALSARSVGQHLCIAARDGWITRRKRRESGKNWANWTYTAVMPERLIGAEPSSGPIQHGAALDADAAEPDAHGPESDGILVRNDVPTNTTANTTDNTTNNTALQKGPGWESWSAMVETLKRKKAANPAVKKGPQDPPAIP